LQIDLAAALLASWPIGSLMRGIAREMGKRTTEVLTEMWKRAGPIGFGALLKYRTPGQGKAAEGSRIGRYERTLTRRSGHDNEIK
jgi:hypothetical protein